MLRLDGKIAIVTGCGSSGPGWGNGKATSVLLARQGAIVVGTDRSEEAAFETRRIIDEEGGRCEVARCDATAPDEVERFVQDTAERFGRIDILVNNVGQSEPGGPVDMNVATWEAQFALNVTSAFLTCKHVIPIMERGGGGAIVNVSSVAALRYIGKPQVGYSAAKAALIQFTRTTAIIHAPSGIRLNCVVPGLMHTPLVERLAEKYAAGDYDGFVKKRHGQVPMGRMGDAWDVAHAALFLASDEARYVTATELVVDGGITAATR
jgi:NAD(P)-dependent dehydrogenase (short-subunit alcohol dehydrogenase family)